MLHSDPYVDDLAPWQLGRAVDLAASPLLVPVVPVKIVGTRGNPVESWRRS